MRHKDLLGVALLLSIAIVFLGRYFLPMIGINIGFVALIGNPVVASFVLAPILLIILFPFNNRLRAWRKRHGRDMDEEERYETEHGMVRLTPNGDQQENK